MVVNLDSKETVGRMGGVNIGHVRKDGWNNALTGLGKRNVDKTVHTVFGNAPKFTDEELTQMYMGDGLAKRIIDLKPQDATREWITTTNDDNDVIEDELDRLDAQTTFKRALSLARLYRGSIIVIIEKGVIDLTKPLRQNPQGITALRVYSAARIDLMTTDINDDTKSIYFDDVEFYRVRTKSGTTLHVHASRCLVFRGDEAPDGGTIDFKYEYWGLPAIMSVYNQVKDWGAVKQSVVNLLMEFNIGKYTLSNLAQMLAANTPEELDKIYTRMDIINSSKSILNSVLLGEDEKYERDSASVSGLDTLMQMMQIDVSAVAGYPVTRLWGRSPAGENATGEGDQNNYYDDVSSMQEIVIQPPLQKLIDIIVNYTSATDGTFIFNPLTQLSEKEQAEVDKLNAETSAIDIQWGVITAEDSAQARYPELDFVKSPLDLSGKDEE